MEKYKKLSLKNDEDADSLVHHLNQDWTIFKEFTGWVVLYRDPQVVVSPAAEPEKPVFRPHREWFEMLKEPLRSQALDALEKYPRNGLPLSSSFSEAFAAAFAWVDTGVYEKWNGVCAFFEGGPGNFTNGYLNDGYELAKQCAPDGWEQQGAGE
jgi:hypothetical protein